jgi:hypothetical protein
LATFNEFKQFLELSYAYYQKAEPKESVAQLWFADVQDIPGRDLAIVFDKLKGLKFFPQNFPYTVRELARSIVRPEGDEKDIKEVALKKYLTNNWDEIEATAHSHNYKVTPEEIAKAEMAPCFACKGLISNETARAWMGKVPGLNVPPDPAEYYRGKFRAFFGSLKNMNRQFGLAQ